MRVEKTIYFIVTKERPIEFYAGDGEVREDFDQAVYFNYMDEAENELNNFDEPEKYEIIKGTLGVEI